MKRTIKYFLLALVITGAPLAYGAKPETPTRLKGATVITAEKAYELVKQGVLMVDSRVALEYVDEHIQGAISIPYKERSKKSIDFDYRKDSWDVKKLPSDKKAPIIIYCNAGRCWRSYKACSAAIRSGYKTVYWLRGGIPEWKQKGLPIE